VNTRMVQATPKAHPSRNRFMTNLPVRDSVPVDDYRDPNPATQMQRTSPSSGPGSTGGGDMSMARTIVGLALGLGIAVLAASAALAGDEAAKIKHPHFEDGGVLTWSSKMADAQKVAKAQRKLILVQYGREA
jgi:hypothetical protein